MAKAPDLPMPKRIQRSRAKGWRWPEGAIYVGRPSKWGNPFVVGHDGTREHCVNLFRLLLGGYLCLTGKADPAYQECYSRMARADIGELRGKDLMCWCPPGPCHADVLLEIANG